jgi:hypothetical protein
MNTSREKEVQKMVHTIFIAVWLGLLLVVTCSDGSHPTDKPLGIIICLWIPALYVVFDKLGLFIFGIGRIILLTIVFYYVTIWLLLCFVCTARPADLRGLKFFGFFADVVE